MNEYDRKDGRKPTPSEEVNVCLEGCRRIAALGWQPTDASRTRIVEGVKKWDELEDDEKAYFVRKLTSKFKQPQRLAAKENYDKYGWGFMFDLLV